VILLDEAGMAPTRPTAALLAQAERAGAKVIAVGDSGQLPSVAAGGWFGAVAGRLGGPALRQVVRQRDPAQREALAALHDGDPDAYLAHKEAQGALIGHEREEDALEATLTDSDAARREHGLAGAVIIARDNIARSILNVRARALLVAQGSLPADGVRIADQEFRIGDRMIARRNDRHRGVDNGTLGRIAAIDAATGELTLITDSDRRCVLDAGYAAAHLEPAYALTGHGAQGATLEWAVVVGRPSEFGREWAYTALSRARGATRVHVIAEATTRQRERARYAPAEPDRTIQEALVAMRCAMRRSEREALAAEHVEPRPPFEAKGKVAGPLPKHAPAETDAEQPALDSHSRPGALARPGASGWRALRRQREHLTRGRSLGR
jgi:ATP-dependent exoDNAse (exonuclease V) alpha subunit